MPAPLSLTDAQRATLISSALAARDGSYSPYSKFRVGACMLKDDHDFVTGANVECASYGGAICAERTAIVKAVSSGTKKFLGLAVTSQVLILPLGGCSGDYLSLWYLSSTLARVLSPRRVGSESATQTGQAFNQVCSASGGTESSASSSVEGEISSTATNSGEASETSSGTPTASSASSSASATNTTSEGSKTSSGASPTATDAGSGVKGLSDSRTTWISFAATLATIAYFGLA
ncbi:cytidine deaminase family protein [Sporobolomyces koalae]|uniref:cytidine deaminase family protein n=1 Tax=Sporobolomyces koalae TaxID=500713 RepID=UPI003172626F